MTIQDLGSIGEFVAALATLVALVYVALQIRQNTTQIKENSKLVRANGASMFDGNRQGGEFPSRVFCLAPTRS